MYDAPPVIRLPQILNFLRDMDADRTTLWEGRLAKIKEYLNYADQCRRSGDPSFDAYLTAELQEAQVLVNVSENYEKWTRGPTPYKLDSSPFCPQSRPQRLLPPSKSKAARQPHPPLLDHGFSSKPDFLGPTTMSDHERRRDKAAVYRVPALRRSEHAPTPEAQRDPFPWTFWYHQHREQVDFLAGWHRRARNERNWDNEAKIALPANFKGPYVFRGRCVYDDHWLAAGRQLGHLRGLLEQHGGSRRHGGRWLLRVVVDDVLKGLAGEARPRDVAPRRGVDVVDDDEATFQLVDEDDAAWLRFLCEPTTSSAGLAEAPGDDDLWQEQRVIWRDAAAEEHPPRWQDLLDYPAVLAERRPALPPGTVRHFRNLAYRLGRTLRHVDDLAERGADLLTRADLDLALHSWECDVETGRDFNFPAAAHLLPPATLRQVVERVSPRHEVLTRGNDAHLCRVVRAGLVDDSVHNRTMLYPSRLASYRRGNTGIDVYVRTNVWTWARPEVRRCVGGGSRRARYFDMRRWPLRQMGVDEVGVHDEDESSFDQLQPPTPQEYSEAGLQRTLQLPGIDPKPAPPLERKAPPELLKMAELDVKRARYGVEGSEQARGSEDAKRGKMSWRANLTAAGTQSRPSNQGDFSRDTTPAQNTLLSPPPDTWLSHDYEDASPPVPLTKLQSDHPQTPSPLQMARNRARTQPFRAQLRRAMPHGYAVVPTSGADLLCGLHALLQSMRHQHPGLPAPTLGQLRRLAGETRNYAWRDGLFLARRGGEMSADHVADVLRRFGEEQACRLRLGVVMAGRGDVLVPSVPDGAVEEDYVFVWIYSDNVVDDPSIARGVNHFSGLRPRREGEDKGMGTDGSVRAWKLEWSSAGCRGPR